MQNRIHSLEDRTFMYKSLGVSPLIDVYTAEAYFVKVSS